MLVFAIHECPIGTSGRDSVLGRRIVVHAERVNVEDAIAIEVGRCVGGGQVTKVFDFPVISDAVTIGIGIIVVVIVIVIIVITWTRRCAIFTGIPTILEALEIGDTIAVVVAGSIGNGQSVCVVVSDFRIIEILELPGVSNTVAIGVGSLVGIGQVAIIVHFPSIWQTITIGVRILSDDNVILLILDLDGITSQVTQHMVRGEIGIDLHTLRMISFPITLGESESYSNAVCGDFGSHIVFGALGGQRLRAIHIGVGIHVLDRPDHRCLLVERVEVEGRAVESNGHCLSVGLVLVQIGHIAVFDHGRGLGVDDDGFGHYLGRLVGGLGQHHIRRIDGDIELVGIGFAVLGIKLAGQVGGGTGYDHQEEVEETIAVRIRRRVKRTSATGEREGHSVFIAIWSPGRFGGQNNRSVEFGFEDAIAVILPELHARSLVRGQRQQVGGGEAIHIREVDSEAGKGQVGDAVGCDIQPRDDIRGSLVGFASGVVIVDVEVFILAEASDCDKCAAEHRPGVFLAFLPPAEFGGVESDGEFAISVTQGQEGDAIRDRHDGSVTTPGDHEIIPFSPDRDGLGARDTLADCGNEDPFLTARRIIVVDTSHLLVVGVDSAGQIIRADGGGGTAQASVVGDVVGLHAPVEGDIIGQTGRHVDGDEQVWHIIIRGRDGAVSPVEMEGIVPEVASILMLQSNIAVDWGVLLGIQDTISIGVLVEGNATFGRILGLLDALEHRHWVKIQDAIEVERELGDIRRSRKPTSVDEVADRDHRHIGVGIHGLPCGGHLGQDGVGHAGAGDHVTGDAGKADGGAVLVGLLIVEGIVVVRFGRVVEVRRQSELVTTSHIDSGAHADEEVVAVVGGDVLGAGEPGGQVFRIGREAALPGIASTLQHGSLQQRHIHVTAREDTRSVCIPPQGDAAGLVIGQSLEVARSHAIDICKGDVDLEELRLVHVERIGDRSRRQCGRSTAHHHERTRVVASQAVAIDEGEVALVGRHSAGATVAEAQGTHAVVGEGIEALANHVANCHDFQASDVLERGDGQAIGLVHHQVFAGGAADHRDLHGQVVVSGLALEHEDAALGHIDRSPAFPGELGASARQGAGRVCGVAVAHSNHADASDGLRLLDVAVEILGDTEGNGLVLGRQFDSFRKVTVLIRVIKVHHAADDHEASAVRIHQDGATADFSRDGHGRTAIKGKFARGCVSQLIFASGEILGDNLD